MAKREAELNNNELNDDNSWLLPMRLRTLSLRQETAELKKINAELLSKLSRLQRQAAPSNQAQAVEAPASSLAQV